MVFFVFTHQMVFAQTVFVSSKGKKYHTEYCKILAEDKKGITIEQAKKEGYKACKKCVEKRVNAIKKQESDEKKKKTEPVGSMIKPSDNCQHFFCLH